MEREYSTLYAMKKRLKLLMFLGEGVEEHIFLFVELQTDAITADRFMNMLCGLIPYFCKKKIHS